MMQKTAEDIAIGAGAVTAPLWLEPANQWLHFFILCGGLILVGIRIYNALKEQSNGTD
jgi:hypothetical protein